MVCKNCGNKIFSGEKCQCGEKAPKVHSVGVAVNSIVCTFLLVISAVCIILTMSFRNIVNNNILVNAIEDINLCEIEVEDSGKTIKLDEYIYNHYVADERITVENVDNILSDPFIKDFIIEKLEGYQKFFMNEGDMEYITSDDIVNLIDENSELLFNEVGLQFLEPDKDQLRNDLSVLDDFRDFSDNYLTGWFSSGLIHTFFSFANVIFLAVLMVVILIQWIIIYKLNARRLVKALRKYSIAVIVPSFLIFAPSLAIVLLSNNEIVLCLSSYTIASGIILGAGIILLFISILISPKNNKNIIDVPSEANENTMDTQPVYAAVAENAAETSTTTETGDSAEKNTADGLCPQCGHQNKAASSFCSQCGTKLK